MTDRTEQRALLAGTVESQLLDMESCGLLASERARLERGEWPKQLWDQLEDNGLMSILVPEQEGGFGGGWEEAGAVLYFTGSYAVPLPVAETLLGRLLLSRGSIHAPEGPLAFAFSDQATLETTPSGRRRLRGSAASVPWAGMAEHLIIVHRDADGSSLALVHRSHVSLVSIRHNIAREPVANLEFRDAEVLAVARVTEDVYALGALLRVASMAGAANSILQQSVQYANDRLQFGRPIAKFQVIQHSLALLASEAAAVHCAAVAACRAADRHAAQFEIAAAKLRANRAVSPITSIAHQVHGAMGFTAESRLHIVTQRLWAWRSDYGNDRFWAARVGAEVARRGASGFWSHLTALADLPPRCQEEA